MEKYVLAGLPFWEEGDEAILDDMADSDDEPQTSIHSKNELKAAQNDSKKNLNDKSK